MLRLKQITSIQNPYIKSLTLLQDKSKTRRQTGLFIIEGLRELSLAIEGGYEIQTLLVYEDICPIADAVSLAPNAELIGINREVFEKLAYRDSTEGVIGVAKSRQLSLDQLTLSDNPLILVAEAPEKPGNIGALLRTADAAKLDAVIIANPKTDMYNPNIVRSSVGCLFTTQIATASTTDIVNYLNQQKISIYCATLQDSANYHLQDFTTAAAIVVGTEAEGLTQEWRDAAKQNIIIPMQGSIDSMNVSVAAAVLIFEAKRQRGFK